jgi:glycosyltransferase involved in cell wall biosynthesis
MKGDPLVSVVLTVFDKAASLPATLASLRAQQGPRAEIVCVDDASRDGSLDLLRAEAARDPLLRVIGNAENRGPAVRLNQGAQAARGRWLHLIDADDLAPPDAQAWMLARLGEAGLPLLYGRRRAGSDPAPIGAATATRIDRPLAFCAGRPVTHMALMVERALFLAAGGADEGVFIQDQSLPLRLAAKAPAMLWTEATVCVAPPAAGPGLSGNRVQQNHDRYRAAMGVLAALAPEADGLREVRALAAGALYKLDRERGVRHWPTVLAYLAAKLGRPPSPAWLSAQRARVAAVPGVRRPEAGR